MARPGCGRLEAQAPGHESAGARLGGGWGSGVVATEGVCQPIDPGPLCGPLAGGGGVGEDFQ